MSHDTVVQRFLQDYSNLFNRALASSSAVKGADIASYFAEYFVGASPKGVRGGRNGWVFRLMMPRGLAFYRRIGTKSMTVKDIDVTPIDDIHASARSDGSSRPSGDRTRPRLSSSSRTSISCRCATTDRRFSGT